MNNMYICIWLTVFMLFSFRMRCFSFPFITFLTYIDEIYHRKSGNFMYLWTSSVQCLIAFTGRIIYDLTLIRTSNVYWQWGVGVIPHVLSVPDFILKHAMTHWLSIRKCIAMKRPILVGHWTHSFNPLFTVELCVLVAVVFQEVGSIVDMICS